MTLLLLACLVVGTMQAQGQSQLVGSDSVQVMFAKPGQTVPISEVITRTDIEQYLEWCWTQKDSVMYQKLDGTYHWTGRTYPHEPSLAGFAEWLKGKR